MIATLLSACEDHTVVVHYSEIAVCKDLPASTRGLNTGFPVVFDDGRHHFESLEGWYDPVPVPTNEGDALLEGFEWLSVNADHRVVLRRAGASVIAFVRSEDSAGFVSRRRQVRK